MPEMTMLDLQFHFTPQVERSKGIHVSDLIKGYTLDILGERAQYDETITHETRLHWEKGFMWERVLSLAFADRNPIRPGEMKLDGVVGSPDGIDFLGATVPGGGIVEDKCTSKSRKTNVLDISTWLMQGMAYLKMVNYITHNNFMKVLYRILYLRGDYGKCQIGDKYPLVEFTPLEIDNNWNTLIKYGFEKGLLK